MEASHTNTKIQIHNLRKCWSCEYRLEVSGPAWLRPSRSLGAQAVWPTQWCIRYWKNLIFLGIFFRIFLGNFFRIFSGRFDISDTTLCSRDIAQWPFLGQAAVAGAAAGIEYSRIVHLLIFIPPEKFGDMSFVSVRFSNVDIEEGEGGPSLPSIMVLSHGVCSNGFHTRRITAAI